MICTFLRNLSTNHQKKRGKKNSNFDNYTFFLGGGGKKLSISCEKYSQISSIDRRIKLLILSLTNLKEITNAVNYLRGKIANFINLLLKKLQMLWIPPAVISEMCKFHQFAWREKKCEVHQFDTEENWELRQLVVKKNCHFCQSVTKKKSLISSIGLWKKLYVSSIGCRKILWNSPVGCW